MELFPNSRVPTPDEVHEGYNYALSRRQLLQYIGRCMAQAQLGYLILQQTSVLHNALVSQQEEGLSSIEWHTVIAFHEASCKDG